MADVCSCDINVWHITPLSTGFSPFQRYILSQMFYVATRFFIAAYDHRSVPKLQTPFIRRNFITAALSYTSVFSVFILKIKNKLMLKFILLPLEATFKMIYARYCNSVPILIASTNCNSELEFTECFSHAFIKSGTIHVTQHVLHTNMTSICVCNGLEIQ
jgi:hypothetical protein